MLKAADKNLKKETFFDFLANAKQLNINQNEIRDTWDGCFQ